MQDAADHVFFLFVEASPVAAAAVAAPWSVVTASGSARGRGRESASGSDVAARGREGRGTPTKRHPLITAHEFQFVTLPRPFYVWGHICLGQ